MNPHAKQPKTISVQITTWFVLTGFVLQLGAGTCGCFEHNGWVQLLHGDTHEQAGLTDAVDAAPDGDATGVLSARNDKGHERPYQSIEDLRECKPLAISNAVLVQSVQLPAPALMVSPVDQWGDSSRLACLAGIRVADGFVQTAFDDGNARLVTQAFLI